MSRKHSIKAGSVEWTTSAGFYKDREKKQPTSITQVQIAEAILGQAELEQFRFTAYTLKIDKHYRFNSTFQALEAVYAKMQPKYIIDGTVDREIKESMHFKSAMSKAARMLGLVSIKTIGTRNKVTGLEVTSLVMNQKDNSEHLKKYANLLRRVKQKHPNMYILPLPNKPCQVTAECSIDVHRLMSDMYNNLNKLHDDLNAELNMPVPLEVKQ